MALVSGSWINGLRQDYAISGYAMKPPKWLSFQEKVVFYLLSLLAVILRMDLEVSQDETWIDEIEQEITQ